MNLIIDQRVSASAFQGQHLGGLRRDDDARLVRRSQFDARNKTVALNFNGLIGNKDLYTWTVTYQALNNVGRNFLSCQSRVDPFGNRGWSECQTRRQSYLVMGWWLDNVHEMRVVREHEGRYSVYVGKLHRHSGITRITAIFTAYMVARPRQNWVVRNTSNNSHTDSDANKFFLFHFSSESMAVRLQGVLNAWRMDSSPASIGNITEFRQALTGRERDCSDVSMTWSE